MPPADADCLCPSSQHRTVPVPAAFCRLPSGPSAACLVGGIYHFMSAGSDLNIDYLANLARLALTEEEKARFARQLGDILHYVEKLSQVDVTGVEPMAQAAPVFNVWQADVTRAGLTAEQALSNAPAQRQNMIVVPKVVE
jgi:aspartyl-tRNA(Asn)/glutamyl-tRNA(Gln) amidotransferase subunit C